MKNTIAFIVIAVACVAVLLITDRATSPGSSGPSATSQIRSDLRTKDHVANVASVKCIDGTPFGASGSTFTCYAYTASDKGIGIVYGTNLGGGSANLAWAPY